MSRLGTNASRRLAPWLDRGLNRASVGSVTSASDAVNKINAFVIDASPKHDLSTESWRAVWIGRFGHDDSQPDGLGRANKGGISTLLDDIDACAPGYAGGCDRATDDTFNSMNQDLGLAADNGWMTFQQLMGWLGRYPVNADDSISPASPPLPPSDPLVIDDRDRMYAAMTDAQIESTCATVVALVPGGLNAASMDACRATYRKNRSDAKAKITRLSPTPDGFMIAKPKDTPTDLPSPEKRAAEAFAVPAALGALGALRWGWASFLVGGAIGVVAATGAYLWTTMRGKSTVTGS